LRKRSEKRNRRANLNKKAKVWGEEKGEVVCPVIYLWKGKGGIMVADNVTGALKHGDEVEILEEDKDPEGWVKISKEVEYKGETYPQEGYVKKSLIKHL
jgi:hypothetical protein